ncbi:Rv1733c family protein [Streptomyces longwoodensis]|uniref:Rv1733c family protein n=1 Tax=Streptomyces longwoodensis TaxID=68231 RepID=UPI0033EA3FCE
MSGGTVLFRRLRRNPLRRRTDLFRAWLGLGLVLAALAATPAALFWAGDTAHRHYARTAQQQAATRHPTPAVLLEDARRHPEPGSAEERRTRYPVEVGFTDAGGVARTATTDVRPGLPRGSTVPVWAGPDGELTGPPLDAGQVRSRAMGWAVLGALAVQGAAAAAYGVAARVLERRDLAAWDAAWRETAPRWTTSP